MTVNKSTQIKTLLNILLTFCLLLLTVSCSEPGGSEAQVGRLLVLNRSHNDSSIRAFDACLLRYSYANAPESAQLSIQQKALEIPFDRWAVAHNYLDFEYVADTSKADIKIVFSDEEALFGEAWTDQSLIPQKIPVLTATSREANQRIIFLRRSFPWTATLLQKALLHQIGNALGLASCHDQSEVMSLDGSYSPSIELTPCEINTVKQVYQEKCDNWERLEDFPEAASISIFDSFSFSTQDAGYCLEALSGSQGLHLYQFSPLTRKWTTNLLSVDKYSSRLACFAIDNIIYVGSDVYDIKTGISTPFFLSFDPKSASSGESWKPISVPPETIQGSSSGFPIGFSIEDKGFVAGYHTWEYTPSDNSWRKMNDGVNPPLFTMFYERLNHFILDNTLYIPRTRGTLGICLSPLKGSSLDNFRTLPYYSNHSFLISFSVRDTGYCLLGAFEDPARVFRFDKDKGWSNPGELSDFPGKGRIVARFVVGNRAYIVTDQKEVWMYRP